MTKTILTDRASTHVQSVLLKNRITICVFALLSFEKNQREVEGKLLSVVQFLHLEKRMKGSLCIPEVNQVVQPLRDSLFHLSLLEVDYQLPIWCSYRIVSLFFHSIPIPSLSRVSSHETILGSVNMTL